MIVRSPFLKMLTDIPEFVDYINDGLHYKEPKMKKKPARERKKMREHAINYGEQKKISDLKNNPSKEVNEVQVGPGVKEDIYAENYAATKQIIIDQLYHIADGIDDMVRTLRDGIRLLQKNRY